MKLIDAEKLKAEIERRIEILKKAELDCAKQGDTETSVYFRGKSVALDEFTCFIDSLQQEQQMPDSTQLIAEWEREKAVLEQKDFRGDAERMAYNAFLDGFVKGIGYGCTK